MGLEQYGLEQCVLGSEIHGENTVYFLESARDGDRDLCRAFVYCESFLDIPEKFSAFSALFISIMAFYQFSWDHPIDSYRLIAACILFNGLFSCISHWTGSLVFSFLDNATMYVPLNMLTASVLSRLVSSKLQSYYITNNFSTKQRYLDTHDQQQSNTDINNEHKNNWKKTEDGILANGIITANESNGTCINTQDINEKNDWKSNSNGKDKGKEKMSWIRFETLRFARISLRSLNYTICVFVIGLNLWNDASYNSSVIFIGTFALPLICLAAIAIIIQKTNHITLYTFDKFGRSARHKIGEKYNYKSRSLGIEIPKYNKYNTIGNMQNIKGDRDSINDYNNITNTITNSKNPKAKRKNVHALTQTNTDQFESMQRQDDDDIYTQLQFEDRETIPVYIEILTIMARIYYMRGLIACIICAIFWLVVENICVEYQWLKYLQCHLIWHIGMSYGLSQLILYFVLIECLSNGHQIYFTNWLNWGCFYDCKCHDRRDIYHNIQNEIKQAIIKQLCKKYKSGNNHNSNNNTDNICRDCPLHHLMKIAVKMVKVIL